MFFVTLSTSNQNRSFCWNTFCKMHFAPDGYPCLLRARDTMLTLSSRLEGSGGIGDGRDGLRRRIHRWDGPGGASEDPHGSQGLPAVSS